jgi:hypothetical protein
LNVERPFLAVQPYKKYPMKKKGKKPTQSFGKLPKVLKNRLLAPKNPPHGGFFLLKQCPKIGAALKKSAPRKPPFA